jgi:competence ComEA-like helix-hairpin-helix protein
MKTARWVGVLGVPVWCLGVGASGLDAKPPSSETTTESKAQRKPDGVKVVVGKVNINEASKTDLMKLAGVTAGVAQKIIAYREAHGPFKRTHDLAKVDAVGKDVLEKNPGRITVK